MWFSSLSMIQYFRDPQATAKAFAGGYFATGDLAVRHADHTISIQDRSKDIIISGGKHLVVKSFNNPMLTVS